MTPSRQEIDHPTSSSSSSTSPTMTSSTVSSDSVARQERGDPCGIDPYPAIVSSERVEWQARGDPYSSEISEEQLLTKPTKNPKPNHSEVLLMDHLWSVRLREVRIWCKHSVSTHFPGDRNCEICQRTKITRARAEDVLAESYFVQKIFGDLIAADHKIVTDKLRISKQSSICSRGARLGF